MALTFSRQYAEGSMGTGVAFGGVVPDSDVIRYLVPGTTKADVLANVDLQAVLTAGTHPDGLPLTVQAANPAERIGSGSNVGWIVEVVFGRNRLSGSDVRITPPDRTSPDYRLDSTSSRIETITIPVLAEFTSTIPVDYLGLTFELITYERQEIKVALPMTQYTLKLNTSTFGSAQVSAITGQTGKIHQFGGRKWLFQNGSMDELEEGVYSLTYTWLHDPGTEAVTIPAPGSGQQYLTTPARGPFQEYVVRPYVDGTSRQRFDVIVVDTYEEDLSGWLGLPGNPSL